MSVRNDVATLIRADWVSIPALAGVRLVATERALDDIKQPTALIRSNTIERLQGAPLSQRKLTLKFTLISPHLDLDRAADQLDDLTDAVLDYLGPKYLHGVASTVGYGDLLAVDIPLTIIASKDA